MPASQAKKVEGRGWLASEDRVFVV